MVPHHTVRASPPNKNSSGHGLRHENKTESTDDARRGNGSVRLEPYSIRLEERQRGFALSRTVSIRFEERERGLEAPFSRTVAAAAAVLEKQTYIICTRTCLSWALT